MTTSQKAALWPISELAARVESALAGTGYEGPANGQVRAVPDTRTIRYYTSLGLLDRPAAMDGRTALYGHRHLLQLVAIKRLQAQGLTLARVQAELVGRGDRELAALADWAPAPRAETSTASPEAAHATQLATAPTPRPQIERRDDSFWKRAPSRPSSNDDVAPRTEDGEPLAPSSLTGIELGLGVVLLFPSFETTAEDIRALRHAAAPLLAVLERRKLLASHGEDG